MKVFYLLILISANLVHTFSLPDINIRNTIIDLIVRNNLKEFLKGFLGLKEDKECEDRLD